MKPINKDEIYEHLSSFLRSRGIELKDGSYVRGIQQTCNFLTDSINFGQEGMQRAKVEFEKSLDRMRQVIHEHTGPRNSAGEPPRAQSTASANAKRGKARASSKKRTRKSQK